jgi:ribosomal-protein-alanine N-acetyltransferase
MSDVTIRAGTPADLERVMEIAAQSETAGHWRREDYENIFSSSRTLLVAEDGNKIVGFLIAHDIAGEWELENIAVAGGFRRQGTGRKLLESLLRAARSNATQCVLLEVRESNFAARKLYESCGFRRYGTRKSYYVKPSEDAVLYRFLCSPAALENC